MFGQTAKLNEYILSIIICVAQWEIIKMAEEDFLRKPRDMWEGVWCHLESKDPEGPLVSRSSIACLRI